MNIVQKLIIQEDFFKDFTKVTDSRQQEWDEAFKLVKKSLEKEAVEYIAEERIKATKIAELSRIKMLA